ncbi:ATP-dependent protease LonB [Mahella sp.]|uniref:ATP-dependent protease LonB n=1 Tax=Mahella sp. TaxID=2798721 RepID=UPI0025BDED9A|nr:ATP-dependent protease LonB [Mahella sp.]MBZ4664963.1 Sigma 54 interacting domain protein [Mahella sp.]MDK2902148.1 ATP-dependent Lon protease [Clostridiales bacterium]
MTTLILLIEFFFAVVIGLYFFNLLKSQQNNRSAIAKESKQELEKLHRMRERSLTQPLSEKTRPASFDDIIGQEEGIKALKAALCGPNPQHVLIYGPPGVGKTAAARLVLEEAKKNSYSPFKKDAKFVEMDATSMRFDERSIADPLIGSVHDPIYQGAGPLGIAGIPQPKPGAVTKAHGGILFLDEIGELHPIQMNKLLKVLEDRKVFFESAYYSSEDSNIPRHIHDIFQNGLPADFRLVGATTRSPDEIPAAIRSRCLEIFFRALLPDEIIRIARNAADKAGFAIDEEASQLIGKYATNGREAVNIIQLAAGIAFIDGKKDITVNDIEWVIESGHYNPRPERRIYDKPRVGCANGMAVYGPHLGMLIEVEASAIPTLKGKGILTITGIVEEEEIGSDMHKVRRTSMAKSSITNVLTALNKCMHIQTRDYDIHINFPGGVPVDGPSAGAAIATAVYSAIMDVPVDNTAAMTGEISIYGEVKPVGGIAAKLEAARAAGVRKVVIPEDNWQAGFDDKNIKLIKVARIEDVLGQVLCRDDKKNAAISATPASMGVLSASSLHDKNKN